MAGVLIYTAAPDSEGTLGGLVSLGEPDILERHLSQALDKMRLCASDPLCCRAPSGQGGQRCTGRRATPACSPRRPRASGATSTWTAPSWCRRWTGTSLRSSGTTKPLGAAHPPAEPSVMDPHPHHHRGRGQARRRRPGRCRGAGRPGRLGVRDDGSPVTGRRGRPAPRPPQPVPAVRGRLALVPLAGLGPRSGHVASDGGPSGAPA